MKGLCISTLVCALLFTLNAHNIYAVFWKVDNAKVQLSNCKHNCVLYGTLRVKPFDGRYELTNDEGVIILSKDNILYVEYTAK